MYRYKKSDNTIGYYDPNGNAAIKSLKRTPINNARVTSSFSTRRKHPVLGFTRAHKGVDFRACHRGFNCIIQKQLYGSSFVSY